MRLTRAGNRERGAVMVELALTIPILFLVIWGIIDFGRAYYTTNSLSSAVREGARVAATRQDPVAARDTVTKRMRNAFTPAGGVPLDTSKVTITFTQATGTVVVTATYGWKYTSPLKLFLGDSITMNRSSTFRYEREAN